MAERTKFDLRGEQSPLFSFINSIPVVCGSYHYAYKSIARGVGLAS
jgi:hypothetical protein